MRITRRWPARSRRSKPLRTNAAGAAHRGARQHGRTRRRCGDDARDASARPRRAPPTRAGRRRIRRSLDAGARAPGFAQDGWSPFERNADAVEWLRETPAPATSCCSRVRACTTSRRSSRGCPRDPAWRCEPSLHRRARRDSGAHAPAREGRRPRRARGESRCAGSRARATSSRSPKPRSRSRKAASSAPRRSGRRARARALATRGSARDRQSARVAAARHRPCRRVARVAAALAHVAGRAVGRRGDSTGCSAKRSRRSTAIPARCRRTSARSCSDPTSRRRRAPSSRQRSVCTSRSSTSTTWAAPKSSARRRRRARSRRTGAARQSARQRRRANAARRAGLARRGREPAAAGRMSAQLGDRVRRRVRACWRSSRRPLIALLRRRRCASTPTRTRRRRTRRRRERRRWAACFLDRAAGRRSRSRTTLASRSACSSSASAALGFIDDFLAIARRPQPRPARADEVSGRPRWSAAAFLSAAPAPARAEPLHACSSIGAGAALAVVRAFAGRDLATTHAVNLTDGLDGLAAGTILPPLAVLAWLAARRQRGRRRRRRRVTGAVPRFLAVQPPSGEDLHGRYRLAGAGRRAGGQRDPHRHATACCRSSAACSPPKPSR